MVDHTTPPTHTRHAIPLFVRNFCHLQPMVRAMTTILYICFAMFCLMYPIRQVKEHALKYYMSNLWSTLAFPTVLHRIPFFLAVWGLLIRFCIPKGKFMVVFVVSAFLELFLLCMMDSYESERCGRADGDGVPVPLQLK